MCIPGLLKRGGVPRGEEDRASLDAIFQEYVLADDRRAWFVDYFTVDAARYLVSYLTADPKLHWTDENLGHRDEHDVPETTWNADEVARWFAPDGDNATHYVHVVNFHADGKPHTLHLSAYNCTLDGLDVESEYVKFGVRGALGAFLPTFQRLESIEIRTL
jgi:hypothetical protein